MGASAPLGKMRKPGRPKTEVDESALVADYATHSITSLSKLYRVAPSRVISILAKHKVKTRRVGNPNTKR